MENNIPTPPSFVPPSPAVPPPAPPLISLASPVPRALPPLPTPPNALPNGVYAVPKRHWKLPIIAIAVFVLVAGGAGAAYYKFVYKPDPEAVLMGALLKISDAKSYHIATVAEATIDTSELGTSSVTSMIPGLPSIPPSLKLNVLNESDIDNSNPNDIKSASKFDVYVGGDFKQTAAFSVAFRQVAGKGYVDFTEIPTFNILDWSKVKNVWFTFDAGALKKELDAKKAGMLSEPDSQARNANAPELKVEEYIAKVFETLKKAKPYRLVQDYGTDSINGVPVWHYGLALDEKGFRDYVTQYAIAVGQPLDAAALSEFDKGWSSYKDAKIDVWVDKNSGRFSRIEVNVNLAVTESFAGATDAKPSNVPLKVVINLSKYGEPVNVVIPSETKPVEELAKAAQEVFMGALFGAMGNFSASGTLDLSSPDDDSDNDGLTNAEEKQYGTDSSKPDTDTDGLSDGDETMFEYGPASTKTDPLKADTDGDGFTDGAELAGGFDPTVKGKKLEAEIVKSITDARKTGMPAGTLHEPTLTTLGIKVMDSVSALNDAKTKSTTAKMLADLKQVGTALELYYNDNNGYPVAAKPLSLGANGAKAICGKVGFADGCRSGSTFYFGGISAGLGTYSTDAKGMHYNIKFTLPSATGMYGAGPHTMTEMGIE